MMDWGCSPQKKPKKKQKKPKKPKNQFPISNVVQHSKLETGFWAFLVFFFQTKLKPKKPKKAKKNQNKNSFQFRILAKTNAKKPKKTQKKQKKNQCQFGNLKKPMPIYRFWCSDWFFFFVFFWVSTPLDFIFNSLMMNLMFSLLQCIY